MPATRTRILFVCMGNICRSPVAEAVFLHRMSARQVSDRFEVDSAGTSGYHAGEPADPRMRATAEKYGVKIASRARAVRASDFDDFDLLVCMDEDNRELILERGGPADRVTLLLEHDDSNHLVEVPDPYYGGQDGFETVFRLVDSACGALLQQLLSSAPEA